MLAPDTLLKERYRIIKVIAEDAMGVVYEALDTRLCSPVALKAILITGAADQQAFEREASILTSLHHPALPRVIDSFVDERGAYLVMEHIAGEDLATLLAARGEPLPAEEVLPWAIELLDAFAYLAAQSPPVLHLGVEPRKLKLSSQGLPVLLDFALPRSVYGLAQQGVARPGSDYDHFRAPEQLLGRALGPRADLYSLAATVAYVLTGHPPADALCRVAALAAGEPDPLIAPRDLNPLLSEGLSTVLLRAMALEPAERQRGAAELRMALSMTIEGLMPGLRRQLDAEGGYGQAVLSPPRLSNSEGGVQKGAHSTQAKDGLFGDLFSRVGELLRSAGGGLAEKADDITRSRPPGEPSEPPVPTSPQSAAAGDVPETPGEAAPSETRERRLDAAMPSVVGLGQTVRLLAQVKLPDARPLGPEDWPAATRPPTVERDGRRLGLTFEREDGVLQPLPLVFEASSDAFAVEPPSFAVEVPPDGESPLVKFRLTARSVGPAEVDVVVRTPDGPILGTAFVGASVGAEAPAEPPLSLATARLTPLVVGAFAGLEMRLEERGEELLATLELDHADGINRSVPVERVPVRLDYAALRAATGDAVAYGRLLGAQLFADPALRDGWASARQHAAERDAALRVSLRLRGGDRLHTLYWEAIRAPQDDLPLALGARTLFSRYLPSADAAGVRLPRRDELRAVLVVASPSDGAAYGLGPLDVALEAAEARLALGGITTRLLARGADSEGRPTLAGIRQALAEGTQVLYLVCHGTGPEGNEAVLWLEDEGGAAAPTMAAELTEMIRLGARPLLVVLASCFSAGGGRGEAMAAVGPRLAEAGVAAVVGFQGQVATVTARRLLRPLFAALGAADGVIDRALAQARYDLRHGAWWQAVLWLRTRDGRLWSAG